MTEVGVIDNFEECASFAVTPLPARSTDRIVELLTNLEAVGDVRAITRSCPAKTTEPCGLFGRRKKLR
jgi:putative heme degradation protein